MLNVIRQGRTFDIGIANQSGCPGRAWAKKEETGAAPYRRRSAMAMMVHTE